LAVRHDDSAKASLSLDFPKIFQCLSRIKKPFDFDFKQKLHHIQRHLNRVSESDRKPIRPFADVCHDPKAVIDLLRTQAQAFGSFRKGDGKLMTWLNPTVRILFRFSATLGE
jgi:hypothetical protein